MNDVAITCGFLTFSLKAVILIAFALLLLFLDGTGGKDLHDVLIAMVEGWSK